MKKLSNLLIAALVVAGLMRMCVYTVNEREYALVFALGELKTVIDEPGIHVKLPPPLQNVVYLDKRILNLDGAGADLVQTSEKKNLLIDTFVKWRIEDPRLYWVSFQGSEPAAANRVSALLRDVLNVVVNKRTVNQITSSEREKAMVEIAQLLEERVRDVGIAIVASEERSKGAAQAERIRAAADRESEVILAQAYRDAQRIKGEGDAEAADIYAKAFGRDPEFARFYRSLDAYRQSFADKSDVMVVDPSADFFRYFKSEDRQ